MTRRFLWITQVHMCGLHSRITSLHYNRTRHRQKSAAMNFVWRRNNMMMPVPGLAVAELRQRINSYVFYPALLDFDSTMKRRERTKNGCAWWRWIKWLCKERKNNSKTPRLLWKWVGGSRSHSEFFCGKSSQNSPKPVVILWSSIPCVFCLYMNC